MKFKKVQQKKKAHPLVRLLIDKMNEQGVGVGEMCSEAGIARNSFGLWGRSQSPKVSNLEACYNVLGYTLAPQKMVGTYEKKSRSDKEYVVTDPAGNEHRIIGLSAFCKANKLDQFEMYRIANTGKTHKGHRVTK